MNAEPTLHSPTSDIPPVSNQRRRGRVLVLLGVGQMVISTLLLLTAATSVWEQPPRWGQILDVFLAFSVVLTGIAIDRAGRTRMSPQLWQQSYSLATYLPSIVFLALWLGHHAFDFNFLTGVAWRVWLILYVLPAGLALWRDPPSP